MKFLGKLLKGILVTVLVLVALIVGGVVGFLKYGLTGTVQKFVLPIVQEQAGVTAELDAISLDIFKGTFNIDGLRIKNPDGFGDSNFVEAESAEVSIDLKSLIEQNPILIKKVALTGAQMHVVRNAEKVVNIFKLQEEVEAALPEITVTEPDLPSSVVESPSAEPAVDVPPVQTEVAAAMPLPALILRSLSVNVKVDYVDESENAPVENGLFGVSLVARNLATATAGDLPWAEIYLIASVDVDGHGFPINFNMLLAPFESPEKLSFDLEGVPFEVDGELIHKAIGKMGVESSRVQFEVGLKARDGVFISPDSEIGTELKGAKIDEAVAGVELIASVLKFKVPVTGTVMAPVVDLQDAIKSIVKNNQKVLVEEMGGQLLKKAIRSEDADNVQSIAKSLGFNLGLTEENDESAETDAKATETETAPEKEESTEDQLLGGVLRVLEQSDKEDGEPESQAISEVLKLFSR